MVTPPRQASRGEASALLGPAPLLRLAGLVLVVACLKWAREFLMPVALAVLLTYLFSPLVSVLERRRVPAVIAVVSVVTLAFVALASLAWVLALQMATLGEQLPKYRDNIRQKIADVRLLRQDTGLERVQETVERAAGEAEREVQRAKPNAGKGPRPTPVIVHYDRGWWDLPAALGGWLEPLGMAGFVVILVPFMLLGRQELRNRTVRMLGFRRLALTTRALDEANERVSRYLLSQTAINAAFGVLATLGLMLLGVPYALLFGLLGGTLRFIPYVGPWIGALLPIAVSLAVFPGWTRPLLVIAFWMVLELFTNLVLETVFWARSAGVSQVGLLLAVGFWTWVWGSVGLVVATPLTVCLLVFAKHIPSLEFLWVLMGDEPVVSPNVVLYQRLLADDADEVNELLERALAEGPRERVHDEIVVPALALAVRDHVHGRIDGAELAVVVQGLREALDSLDPAAPEAADAAAERRVLAVPARGEADAVTLLALRDLLVPARVAVDVLSPALLAAEIVERARRHGADVIAIGSLPPGGLAQARYLTKRVRAALPSARIVVGRWCAGDELEAARQALLAAGADAVAATLRETRDLILSYGRVQPEVASTPAA
jgi:predicted PurR-regulated permease PerM